MQKSGIVAPAVNVVLLQIQHPRPIEIGRVQGLTVRVDILAMNDDWILGFDIYERFYFSLLWKYIGGSLDLYYRLL